MDEELKCFVCQSQSDGTSSRRSSEKGSKSKSNDCCNHLDGSTWTTFCHYFYPPPLDILYSDNSSSINCPAPKNEHYSEDIKDFSLPVLCEACYQTILRLCSLHSQLELIQKQVSQIVAQVAITFVQEDEHHDDENEEHNKDTDRDDTNTRNNFDGHPSAGNQRKRKMGSQTFDDDIIYSMRRCIRQRYQPFICISRANPDLSKQNGGGGDGSRCINNLKAGESSLRSTHSNELNLDLDLHLDSDVDFSPSIKQEDDEDSIDIKDEDGCQGDQGEAGSDPDYEPDNDSDAKSLAKRKVSLPHYSSIKRTSKSKSEPRKRKRNLPVDPQIFVYKDQWSYERKLDESGKIGYYCLTCPKVKAERYTLLKHIEAQHVKVPKKRKKMPPNFLRPTKDPQVGENIYEYKGQFRYEKKLDERGNVGYYCLTCSKVKAHRYLLIQHFESTHKVGRVPRGARVPDAVRVPKAERVKTQKLDEDNFVFYGIYSISRVTEPNGIFFKCGTCGNHRKTLDALKKHIKETHIDPKKWICEKCGFSCPTKFRYDIHMESHEEERKYVCDECGMSFKFRRGLHFHLETHLGHRFVCECGVPFIHFIQFKLHAKKNNHHIPSSESTPFVPKNCEFCSKVFVKEETLRKHSSSCSRMKTKKCDSCGLFYRKQKSHESKCKGRLRKETKADSNNI